MKKLKCGWIIFLLLIAYNVSGQQIIDSYQLSTSNSDKLSENGFFISKNPSSIITVTSSRIKLSQLIPYSISALRINSISYSNLYKNKGFAIEYFQSGLNRFKEHQLCFVTAIRLSKNIGLGIKIISKSMVLQDLGWKYGYQYELGLQQDLSKTLKIGVHYINTSNDEFNKQRVCIAMNNRWGNKLNAYTNIEMKDNGTIYTRIGFNYTFHPKINIRTGWSNRESLFSTGLLYSWKQFDLEMGASIHQTLGMSYGAGLSYKIHQ